jgi:ribonuclease Z
MTAVTRASRFLVILGTVLFTAVGLGFWFAPESTAAQLGFEATSASSLMAARADLGGLFIGMAALSAAAIRTGRRAFYYSVASILGAIAFGRSIGWITVGPSNDVADMGIELGLVAAMLFAAREPRSEAASAKKRRFLVPAAVSAASVIVTAGAAAAFSPTVQQRLFDKAAAERTGSVNTAPLADDALRVAICGSSAPLPSATRAKACVAVFAGGKFYLVDVGPESVENLVLWGIPLSQVGGALLTHYHSDHVGDLGELNLQTWAGGRPAPLAVYGGPGIENVVEGFNQAYRLDQGYRTRHHGEKVMPPATWPMIPHTINLDGEPTPAKDRTGLVLDDGTLRITAIEVDHAPISPAYAYRFDYKGRSVVVTGDLKFHKPLAKSADGADLMVSEAIAVSMTRALGKGASDAGRPQAAAIMHDIEDYHITPEQAAGIANEAHVKLLAFYHLLPSPDTFLTRRLFAKGLDEVRRGGWTIADDGSLYTLPIGSKEVQIGSVTE